MIRIGKIQNRYILSLISFVLISLIDLIDYITGSEFSFFIFYLIPIIFITLYRGSTKPTIIVNTLFASIIWFIANHYTKEYTNSFAPYRNAFVRFAIFVIVGLLVFNIKEKYQKLIQINIDLKRLDEEKNKFIGIAAHDLRNPIGGIYSFSDLLISNFSEKLDLKVKEIIEYIKALSKNTLDLIKKTC